MFLMILLTYSIRWTWTAKMASLNAGNDRDFVLEPKNKLEDQSELLFRITSVSSAEETVIPTSTLQHQQPLQIRAHLQPGSEPWQKDEPRIFTMAAVVARLEPVTDIPDWLDLDGSDSAEVLEYYEGPTQTPSEVDSATKKPGKKQGETRGKAQDEIQDEERPDGEKSKIQKLLEKLKGHGLFYVALIAIAVAFVLVTLTYFYFSHKRSRKGGGVPQLIFRGSPKEDVSWWRPYQGSRSRSKSRERDRYREKEASRKAPSRRSSRRYSDRNRGPVY